MHVLSCMIDSTRPPIHLDFYERKKARSRREHTSYSIKQILYIYRWLCAQKNARQFTSQEIQNMQRDREAQQLTQTREKEELVAKKKEELYVEQLRVVWQSIRGAGFQSLHDYLHTLFNTRDPILSAQVSRMLSYHGFELLDSIHACHRW